jgi:hypothetical protein
LFRVRVWALLDAGRYAFAEAVDAEGDPTRTELGWRDGNVVYLTNQCFEAVGCGTFFSSTAGAVRRQLLSDGMLADRDDNQLTVRRNRHGRQGRVTAVKAASLGFGDERADGGDNLACHGGRVIALTPNRAGERVA